MSKINIRVNGSNFEQIGWKYYNTILKKAMEQEFSWSGLSVSLSIAFFVVIVSAQGLNMTYRYLSAENMSKEMKVKIYELESANFRNNPGSLSVEMPKIA